MSTNNQASQTLFRFVSLRSPQLSDDKGQDKRFILAPDKLKYTHFYQFVLQHPNESKIRSLNEYAEPFSQTTDCITDKDYLKNHFPELYDFSSWIARNKENYFEDELKEKCHHINDLFSTDEKLEIALLLWNNLIYQVVTQKDFYIKEIVMQMLLALHIAQNFDSVKSSILVNARIVLPRDLMMDAPDALPIGIASRTASLESSGQTTTPSLSMQKQQKVQESKALLQNFEILKKEISLMEKRYQKEYQFAYTEAEQAYQSEIQPTIDNYNRDVENARRRYCEIRNPELPYDPKDPCNKPEDVPYPNLPKFDFQFRPEIEGSSLSSGLKPSSIDALLYVLDYDFSEERGEESTQIINNLLAGRDTFSEMYSLIQDATDKANKTLINNVEDDTETFTSVGGVIIPIARVETVPFTYQLCPQTILRNTSLNLALDVPDSSWDVSSMSYTLYTNVGPLSGSYFEKSRIGNKIFLNKLLGSTTSDGVYIFQTTNFTLDVTVTFTNGKTTTFHPIIETMKSCYSSSFEFINETPDPGHETDDSFIPSGFGFKQIGIADYLKVEQTTHAYVEGEVAHIENVMAREYREKSTRRLRRSENTTTTSSDTEKEKLTDTTTATRFEMQSEIAKILQESKDVGAYANFGANWGPKQASYSINVGATYAHHSSKEESTRQATTQAQDITARALDRVVTKVHEERIEKIIEEFEENNKHGFDNTKGDKHVVGVFRWVDKLMKNQIYNYGKRLMFEFMVPQPAKLHQLGMKLDKSADSTKLEKPVDPRDSATLPMSSFLSLENDAVLQKWVSKYNVELDEKPQEYIEIGKALDFSSTESRQAQGKKEIISIPEGYKTFKCKASLTCVSPGTYNGWGSNSFITMGNITKFFGGSIPEISTPYIDVSEFIGEFPISVGHTNLHILNLNVIVKCKLLQEAKDMWLQKTFKAIIDAYENALAEYNNKVAEEKATGVQIKGSNPGFYRQIENTILRKNCISYMIDRTTNSTHGYGMAGLTTGGSFSDYETVLSTKLDKYTAFLKFMEQAFEWENLSYYLYPYYWANKTEWSGLYQQEDTDPLFRAFLQSGMARVVVTVRPGFEDAVQFYMATGKIWNGGEVPVIGDPLYLSIVDEMKEPKGEKQGKAWITRLPTPLNILQAESIGLKVQHALPFSTENPDEFEVPSEVITQSNFEKINALMETSADKQIANVSIDESNINFTTSKGEMVTQLSISDLVNAERQIDNIFIRENQLVLSYKEDEVTSIPLEVLRKEMGL